MLSALVFALPESALAAVRHGMHRRHHVAQLEHRRAYRNRHAVRLAAETERWSPSGYVQMGRASFYSGGRTASGGGVGFATCAHRSLPFGTRVRVTNLANQRQMVLTVNDRGPFARGRVVDVSRAAAGVLGMLVSGIASVRVEVIGRAS